jgi:hypothetical protein
VGSVSDKAARLRACAQTCCGLLYCETFIGCASLKRCRNGKEQGEAEEDPDPYKRGRVNVGG